MIEHSWKWKTEKQGGQVWLKLKSPPPQAGQGVLLDGLASDPFFALYQMQLSQ